MEQKIPKIIHYCWFGGNPKPQLVLNCIESWKRFCPDYEIIEWNETNFDIHSNTFVEEAYEAKKWAFVSDYARAIALLQYGGVYLDTDMEIMQPIDRLLEKSFFAGFEVRDTVAAGIIGCEKESQIMKSYAEHYHEAQFYINGKHTMTTSPIVLTEILIKKGLRLNGKEQSIGDCLVCSKTTFYPTGIGWVVDKYSSKTLAVHHYLESWGKNRGLADRSWLSKLRLCILFFVRNCVGTNTVYRIGQRIKRKRS